MASDPTTDTAHSAGPARGRGSRYTLILKLAFLLVVVGAAYSVGYWRNQPQAPQSDANVRAQAAFVGFEPALIDLGPLPWFSQEPFEAVFVNRGETAVRVAVVRADCGCMGLDSGAYMDTVVEAGGELAVGATLDVGPGPGQETKQIDLMLDSGAVHTAFVKYKVVATYSCRPGKLAFARVGLDHAEQETLASAIFSSPTARIVDFSVDSPWLNVGLDERDNGETEIVVELVKRNLVHGMNYGRVDFVTDDSARPQFTLPVEAEGVSQLRPVPGRVFLRVGEQKTVRFVRGADAEALRLVSAGAEGEAVAVSINADQTTVSVALRSKSAVGPVVVSVTDDRGLTATFLVFEVE